MPGLATTGAGDALAGGRAALGIQPILFFKAAERALRSRAHVHAFASRRTQRVVGLAGERVVHAGPTQQPVGIGGVQIQQRLLRLAVAFLQLHARGQVVVVTGRFVVPGHLVVTQVVDGPGVLATAVHQLAFANRIILAVEAERPSIRRLGILQLGQARLFLGWIAAFVFGLCLFVFSQSL